MTDISHLAQAMSPAERITLTVRIVMLAQKINPDQLNGTITALVTHAFSMGMASAITDPEKPVEQRVNEYLKTRSIKG